MEDCEIRFDTQLCIKPSFIGKYRKFENEFLKKKISFWLLGPKSVLPFCTKKAYPCKEF